MPIDILAGSDRLRNDIEIGVDLDKMEKWWSEECYLFAKNKRKSYLLYD